LVERGLFDPELAQWLGLCIEVPPLRERPEDLESNVWVALYRASRVLGRAPVGIEPDALAALSGHDWPGNVAELLVVLERAVQACSGARVRLQDLPPLVGREERRPRDPLDRTYHELERELLTRALERSAQNKSEAARILGLKRSTFIDKLRRQGIETSL
jgi:DNA-binding NtrC family response regulator